MAPPACRHGGCTTLDIRISSVPHNHDHPSSCCGLPALATAGGGSQRPSQWRQYDFSQARVRAAARPRARARPAGGRLRPDRRGVDHRPRHRPERRRGSRRHRRGHQPGHERRVHRRHERDGQLRHPVGARRPVRRQGGAVRVQDDVHPADHARGKADRPYRPEDGGRRARGHRRGDRPGPRASNRDGHGRRGHLGQHRAVAAAERPQRQPAGAPPARGGHAEPGLLHDGPQLGRRRPALHQRQPRADEQLPDRRRRHERDGRQPDRLPAEPRRPRRDQRGDEQLLGRRRQRRRRGDQQRHQVGCEPVPRERVRVLPQQRLRREHVGQQPLERDEGRAHPAHLRRHSRRADRQEQAVLLRGLPGHGPRPARGRDGVGRPGRLAHGRSLEPAPGHRHPGPRHQAALPEQPDPAEPDQSRRRSGSSTARTTRFPTAT